MCVPQQNPTVAAASTVPSMQAADNLQIGGAAAPRGAAQLGRLALRFGGTSSGATSSASAATSQAAAIQASTPAATSSALTPAAEAQFAGVGTAPGSLAGLRFGNYNQSFQP